MFGVFVVVVSGFCLFCLGLLFFSPLAAQFLKRPFLHHLPLLSLANAWLLIYFNKAVF